MPAAVKNIKSTGKKKRRGATASNNDERSGPQKKRRRCECSADGCSNIAQKGGVCVKHGAQVKQCSFDGCSNIVVNGGVCVKHGAKRERCSVDGCPNLAQRRGVCIRHGAKRKRCRFAGCPNQAKRRGVCVRHGAKHKRCSVDGCTNQVRRRGVCRRHGAYSDGTPRANIQVENNLERDDRNTASALQISDDDAGGTQPQGVDRKGKTAEKQSNKLTSNNSVGEKDEAVLFEKGPITVKNIEKPHQQSDDGSSDNEASEDEAPTYTFNGKRYASYQDMCNAKRKRNQDFLDQSGLLKSSKRPPQPVAHNKSNKRRQTSVSKKPTRRSKRLSGLNRLDYNEDAASTESGDDVDRQEEEEEESTARALEDEEQDPLNDEGRSQTENDCKGDAAAELTQHTTANGIEREVLSEQDEGQKTLAGSDKRPRINSSSDGDDDSKVGGGNDDEASGIVSGGEEQERSHQDSIDGNEVESPRCDDSFDGANQQDVFSPEKEDHEVSEDERKSCVFGHHEGMAFSERGEAGVTPEVGEINLTEGAELHLGSALESERTAFVSKEDAKHYVLQMKQMKERNSALEEAAKLKETIESELRSKLAEQVKTTANLKAQLDQVTGEKIKLEEQRLHHSKGWDEERQRMEAEHAAVVRRQEAELKAKDNQLSALKSSVLGSSRRYPERKSRNSGHEESLIQKLTEELEAAKSNEAASKEKLKKMRATLAAAKTGEKEGVMTNNRTTTTTSGSVHKDRARGQEKDNEEISALRHEIMSTVKTSTVTMNAVGGMQGVKEALLDAVILPKKSAQRPALALLYGPPGTGKTHIVKAVANRAKCTLFSIKASDIGSKWIGQSEKKVTLLFEEAQKQDYSIIFIDELDCICSNRDSSPDEHGKKVLTSFLTEINRIGDDINNVSVLAATNKPWDLDSAVQDRFDTKVYVPLPDLETRRSILQLQLEEHENSLDDADLQRLAQLTEGATAREVEALARKACRSSMRGDAYLKEDEKYTPVSRCDCCPEYEEGSEAKCHQCGAISISPYDMPDGSLKSRSVLAADFVEHLKPSYGSVTDEMKQRYRRWQGN